MPNPVNHRQSATTTEGAPAATTRRRISDPELLRLLMNSETYATRSVTNPASRHRSLASSPSEASVLRTPAVPQRPTTRVASQQRVSRPQLQNPQLEQAVPTNSASPVRRLGGSKIAQVFQPAETVIPQQLEYALDREQKAALRLVGGASAFIVLLAVVASCCASPAVDDARAPKATVPTALARKVTASTLPIVAEARIQSDQKFKSAEKSTDAKNQAELNSKTRSITTQPDTEVRPIYIPGDLTIAASAASSEGVITSASVSRSFSHQTVHNYVFESDPPSSDEAAKSSKASQEQPDHEKLKDPAASDKIAVASKGRVTRQRQGSVPRGESLLVNLLQTFLGTSDQIVLSPGSMLLPVSSSKEPIWQYARAASLFWNVEPRRASRNWNRPMVPLAPLAIDHPDRLRYQAAGDAAMAFIMAFDEFHGHVKGEANKVKTKQPPEFELPKAAAPALIASAQMIPSLREHAQTTLGSTNAASITASPSHGFSKHRLANMLYIGGLAYYSSGDSRQSAQLLTRLRLDFPDYQREVDTNTQPAPLSQHPRPTAPWIDKLLFALYVQSLEQLNTNDAATELRATEPQDFDQRASLQPIVQQEPAAANEEPAQSASTKQADSLEILREGTRLALQALASHREYLQLVSGRPERFDHYLIVSEYRGDPQPDQQRAQSLPEIDELLEQMLFAKYFPLAVKESGRGAVRQFLITLAGERTTARVSEDGLTIEWPEPLSQFANDRLAALDKPVLDSYRKQVAQHLSQKNFSAARSLLKKIASEYPGTAAGSSARAEMDQLQAKILDQYRTEGEKHYNPAEQVNVPQSKARAYFEKMFKEDPEGGRADYALLHWSLALGTEGKLQQAIDQLKSLLQKFPGSEFEAQAKYTIGFYYGQSALRKYETAVQCMELVASDHPNSSEAPEALWHAAYFCYLDKKGAEGQKYLDTLNAYTDSPRHQHIASLREMLTKVTK